MTLERLFLIDSLFEELKISVLNDWEVKSGRYTAEELIRSGFVKKIVDAFWKATNFLTEVDDYFQQKCYHLSQEEVGSFAVEGGTIGEFVFNIKCLTIKAYLNLQLSKYLISKGIGKKDETNK